MHWTPVQGARFHQRHPSWPRPGRGCDIGSCRPPSPCLVDHFVPHTKNPPSLAVLCPFASKFGIVDRTSENQTETTWTGLPTRALARATTTALGGLPAATLGGVRWRLPEIGSHAFPVGCTHGYLPLNKQQLLASESQSMSSVRFGMLVDCIIPGSD